MDFTESTGANPTEGRHQDTHHGAHDTAADIADRFHRFTLDQQQAQPEYPYTRSQYEPHFGRGTARSSPNPDPSPFTNHRYGDGDGNLFHPESPMPYTRPSSIFYSPHNRFSHNCGSLISSTASNTSAANSFTESLAGTSFRSPPRPFDNSEQISRIDDTIHGNRPLDTPRPSSSASQRPPQSSSSTVTPQPPPSHYLAIGIDFGTTYSGVSWACSWKPHSFHDVQQYPSAAGNTRGRDEAQVPTLYCMESDTWGYLIKGDEDPIRWFKLLLLNDDDIQQDIQNSAYLQRTRDLAKQLGKGAPEKLVADFLRQLWRHAQHEIALDMSQDTVDSLPFKVALTVPAIWPGYAKERMKRAARLAGILDARDAGVTDLILVQEPEAAALSTLMERLEYPNMKVDETFMVVDCGGGTVDIISYKVMSIQPFRVCEVVGGAGKLCGAFMVDDKFVDYMKTKTGFKFDHCDPDEWRRFVSSEWEHGLKRSFAYGPSQPAEEHLTPPIRATPTLYRIAPARMANRKVVLSRDVINGFFEETYQGINGLVRAQYDAIMRAEGGHPPQNIVLVGGLGSSRYLLARLQEDFSHVVQPRQSWSAVARGAVVALLRNYYSPDDVARHPGFSVLPEVASRIARLSYGVETGIPVYEAVPPVDRAIDRLYGRGAVERVWRMVWFVTKGETLDNRDPVSHDFYEYVNDHSMTSTTFKIYVSDSDTPPARRDASCNLLCRLRCGYDVAFESLRIIDPQRGLRVVDNMHLTMRFGAEPEWQLQVGARDVKEKVNVQFEIR